MENNVIFKGLWAGIIISLAIGNIFIIPIGEINHILMVGVASITLIILIIVLIFLMTRKHRDQTPNQDKVLEDQSIYYSFTNNTAQYNYSAPKNNYSPLSNPMGINYYIYANYNQPSNRAARKIAARPPSNVSILPKKVKTYQLPDNSIFEIPTPQNGANPKIFLEEHMTKAEKRFLNELAT
jgi:hypothetical protein